jgi:hypothetical protein
MIGTTETIPSQLTEKDWNDPRATGYSARGIVCVWCARDYAALARCFLSRLNPTMNAGFTVHMVWISSGMQPKALM